jgi:hypothetical protein
MPFYGEVWRQTEARDLRAKSDVPLLTRYFSEDERLALLNEVTTNPQENENQLNVLFDTSDEEIDGEDGHEKEEDKSVTADDERAESSTITRYVSGSRDGIEENGRRVCNEMEGEQIKEQSELLERRLTRLVQTLQEIRKYPPGHRHLREIPSLQGSVNSVGLV